MICNKVNAYGARGLQDTAKIPILFRPVPPTGRILRQALRISAGLMLGVCAWGVGLQAQPQPPGAGVLVRGRVLDLGKPVADARVFLAGDKSFQLELETQEARTAADGTFEFSRVQANTHWLIFGALASFKDRGALRSQPIPSGDDGTSNDLGDLLTRRALFVAGRLKTRYGERPPRGTMLKLVFDESGESVTTHPDSEGRFRFDGLYTGHVKMSLQAREWRLSGANGSDSFTDANDLTATLLADKDDLEIEIERDDSREGAPEDESGQVPAKDDPASHALSGVERSREADNILDGQVVDDATGRLIPNFRVIPGYQPPLAPAEPKPLWQQTLQLFAK